MTDSKQQTVGEDGIFKILTWSSSAITKVFGLPEIVGDPIQQELQFPTQRRVDRLYKLADGSLLNIEHQSSISDRDALARRMIVYHLMIKNIFPRVPLLQIVIYTGKEPIDRTKIGNKLKYSSVDTTENHGIHFTAELRDFRSVPTDEFRRSGKIDDLILGLMAMGGDDQGYIDEVVSMVSSLKGASRQDAIEKCLAVCATMPDRKAAQLNMKGVDMWIDEVKDTPLVKKIVEIAGREQIEATAKTAYARVIISNAIKLGVSVPEDGIALLVAYAEEETLFDMAANTQDMTDFGDFVKSYGIKLPGYDT